MGRPTINRSWKIDYILSDFKWPITGIFMKTEFDKKAFLSLQLKMKKFYKKSINYLTAATSNPKNYVMVVLFYFGLYICISRDRRLADK